LEIFDHIPQQDGSMANTSSADDTSELRATMRRYMEHRQTALGLSAEAAVAQQRLLQSASTSSRPRERQPGDIMHGMTTGSTGTIIGNYGTHQIPMSQEALNQMEAQRVEQERLRRMAHMPGVLPPTNKRKMRLENE
jgi:hypothetical protein